MRPVLLPLGFLLAPALAWGAEQTTECVSVNGTGAHGNDRTSWVLVSADARSAAFTSDASDLVPHDGNGVADVFVRDLVRGRTTRVSVSTAGVEADAACYVSSISADGRFVLFSSRATNLVPGDVNGVEDVFQHDRIHGTTRLVSLDPQGLQANAGSQNAFGTSDGRFVAFSSSATNLVMGDSNSRPDVFVKDLDTGQVRRASQTTNGVGGNDYSDRPRISADGRFVVFRSGATNLGSWDLNGRDDVFLHDLMLGTTERVSLTWQGGEADGTSDAGIPSADGRYVLFHSSADNLVPPGSVTMGKNVFLRDRLLGTTVLISAGQQGSPVNNECLAADLSPDGRIALFYSLAKNLVPGDTNHVGDVFVRDTRTGATERVSVTAYGAQANDISYPGGTLSSDGRFASYHSRATNLVHGDRNGEEDAFLRDRGADAANDRDTILLTCAPEFAVGESPILSWFATPAGAEWFLLTSASNAGSTIAGHAFGLGPSSRVQARGVCTARGTGQFRTAPFPAWTQGRTVYLEVAARDAGGRIYDSNTVERTVQ